MFARQPNKIASFPGLLFTQKLGFTSCAPACRKISICEIDSSDAREVTLAPERVKRGKDTFFDMQRAITVLPLYIALMRFLIKVKQHDLPDVIQCLQSCCKALFSAHKYKKTVSLTLTVFGRGRRIRTLGTRFWRPLLYQLSYAPMKNTHHAIFALWVLYWSC